MINDPGGANVIDITAKGSAPLGLANSFLAERGTQIKGKALVDLSLSGQANAPVVIGSVSARDATINDPTTGISLVDTSVAARLSDGKLDITRLNARSRNGGTIEASGTLNISAPGKQLPASFTLSTDDFKFTDGRIVAGETSSSISLDGDFHDQVTLSGTADIARLDVRIPQALPASVTALELKHKNAPEHVRASQSAPEERDNAEFPLKIKLSLDLRSANRIFVTGRGLDAQLGGQLQLSGSADDPRAIGEFTLERGTMAVLGRSLDITSGTLDFSGDLDPRLNFEAVTEVDDTTITIALTGNASEPQFSFSSQPELPEDEILALLLFNRSFSELSTAQLVQLAAQVSELGGLTGGAGVFGKLRSSLGVDRLDVTTTEDGELAVTAGSAVNENLFVGVEQGTGGESSRVKIDLDVTENVKIRGEAGADGESKLGVGFEWEY
jgi:translocation and assembly module TamB